MNIHFTNELHGTELLALWFIDSRIDRVSGYLLKGLLYVSRHCSNVIYSVPPGAFLAINKQFSWAGAQIIRAGGIYKYYKVTKVEYLFSSFI